MCRDEEDCPQNDGIVYALDFSELGFLVPQDSLREALRATRISVERHPEISNEYLFTALPSNYPEPPRFRYLETVTPPGSTNTYRVYIQHDSWRPSPAQPDLEGEINFSEDHVVFGRNGRRRKDQTRRRLNQMQDPARIPFSEVSAPDSHCEQCRQTGEEAQEEDEEGVASFISGALYGDFAENDSWSAIAGQAVVGFTPLGIVADIRDTAAAVGNFVDGRPGSSLELGLAIVGFIPGGDILKSLGRTARRSASSLDNIADAAIRADIDESLDQALRRLDEPGHEMFERSGEFIDAHPYRSTRRQRRLWETQRTRGIPEGRRIPQRRGIDDVVTGATHEAMHIGPQSLLRGLPGYNERSALAVLYNRTKHRAFDAFWQRSFRRLIREGRENVSVREARRIMHEAIDESGSFSPETARSLKDMFDDEVYNQLGLLDDDLLRIPGLTQ